MATKIIKRGDTLIQYLPHTHAGSETSGGMCYSDIPHTVTTQCGLPVAWSEGPMTYKGATGIYNETLEKQGAIYYISSCGVNKHNPVITKYKVSLNSPCLYCYSKTVYDLECSATTNGDLKIKDYTSGGFYYIDITPEDMLSGSSITSIKLILNETEILPTVSENTYTFKIEANGVYQLVVNYSDRGNDRTDDGEEYEIQDYYAIGKIYVGNHKVVAVYLGNKKMSQVSIGDRVL